MNYQSQLYKLFLKKAREKFILNLANVSSDFLSEAVRFRSNRKIKMRSKRFNFLASFFSTEPHVFLLLSFF